MGETKRKGLGLAWAKVFAAFWRDEAVMALSTDEKLVAIYCLTGPQKRGCGIFSFSIGAGFEDCGFDYETFRKHFANVVRTLEWRYDETFRVLYIPEWWKWNTPDNQNQLKGCMKTLGELPKTELLKDFAANTKHLPAVLHKTFAQTLAKPLGEPLGEPLGKPSRTQEQGTGSRNRSRNRN